MAETQYTLEQLKAERDRREQQFTLEQLKAERERRRNAKAQAEAEAAAEAEGSVTEGILETVGTIGSAMLAEPIAGLRGAAATYGSELAEAIHGDVPGVDPRIQGAQEVERTQEALTMQPETARGQEYMANVADVVAPVGEFFEAGSSFLGDVTMEATDDPAMAAAAYTIPTAVAEALGLGVIGKFSRGGKAAERAAGEAPKVPEPVFEPEAKTMEEITEDLKKGKEEAAAEQVMPDPEIQAAAQRRGVDLNPEHYSTNEAFARVSGALKAMPESKLEVNEVEAIKKVGKEADELIEDYAGTIDKTAIGDDLFERMGSKEAELGESSDAVYKTVNDEINKAGAAAKLNLDESVAQRYISARLEELGDDVSGLTAPERELYNVISQEKPPTYARLDQLRRDIGDGYKRQGKFKDDASGTLDQVYSVLIRDQQSMADDFGVGPEFAAARKLTQQRKDVQKAMTDLFGKNLGKSLVETMSSAATGLTKGNVTRFRRMMEALPEGARRQVAATMLNDLFTQGARGNRSFGLGFANAYEGLNRNPTAKAELFKYLPEDAQERFDDIGKISMGIHRAQKWANTSRSGATVLRALDSGEMVNKLYGWGKGAAHVVLPGQALPTVAAAGIDALQAASSRAKAVDKLLASDDFQLAIDLAMENKIKEANIILKRNERWQNLKKKLSSAELQQLAAVGPIAWLVGSSTDQEQAGGQ